MGAVLIGQREVRHAAENALRGGRIEVGLFELGQAALEILQPLGAGRFRREAGQVGRVEQHPARELPLRLALQQRAEARVRRGRAMGADQRQPEFFLGFGRARLQREQAFAHLYGLVAAAARRVECGVTALPQRQIVRRQFGRAAQCGGARRPVLRGGGGLSQGIPGRGLGGQPFDQALRMEARGGRIAARQCVGNQPQPCGRYAGELADRGEFAFGFVEPVQQAEHVAAQERAGRGLRLQPVQLRRGLVRLGQAAGFQRIDREFAPGRGQTRFQRDSLAQRGRAGDALAACAQQLAQLQMQSRVARPPRQRAAADFLGCRRVAAAQSLLDFLG
ncbi:hypothetical protein ACFJIW_23605 [Tahibacter sp. UC22_41]|uniref:hypothetical protein n=1 Tax=Tahibacter sp. UC22_41 TaxID=3350178 RepID=UPI0036DB3CDB